MDRHHSSNITKLKKKKFKSLDGTKVQQAEWLFFFVVDFLQNGNIKNEKKKGIFFRKYMIFENKNLPKFQEFFC
jgi:hypothetical protein